MKFFNKVLLILLGVFCLAFALFSFRAYKVVSKQIKTTSAPLQLAIKTDEIAEHLSRAIQFTSDSAELYRYHLKKVFPSVFGYCEVNEGFAPSVVLRCKGSSTAKPPILFLAHFDVVPPGDLERWQVPPFSGRIKDGFIWGRGTMDDKGSLLGLLEALETLLKSGKVPSREIYFAFGHDEETMGKNGAKRIAAFFETQGIKFDLVLDEGMPIVEGAPYKVNSPIALLGIAEKGYLTIKLRTESSGGHSSQPPRETAITILAEALQKLKKHPMPPSSKPVMLQTTEFLAPEQGFSRRLITANMGLLRAILVPIFGTDTQIRTTITATQINAGVAENVLPQSAEAVLNIRIIQDGGPGDPLERIVGHIKNVLDGMPVSVTVVPGSYQAFSGVSPTTSDVFQKVMESVKRVFPDTIAVPILTTAITDARYYVNLSENVLRFLPIRLHGQDVNRYHGIDERIAIKNYEEIVRFYAEIMISL